MAGPRWRWSGGCRRRGWRCRVWVGRFRTPPRGAPATKPGARRSARSRARREAAAKLLGLRFEEFRSVDLNPTSAPAPMPRAMMAAAMPAPNAVAEAVPVSATLTAEAALAP